MVSTSHYEHYYTHGISCRGLVGVKQGAKKGKMPAHKGSENTKCKGEWLIYTLPPNIKMQYLANVSQTPDSTQECGDDDK